MNAKKKPPLTADHSPHNISAEEQVVGAILLQPEYIDKCDMDASDFYATKHRAIYCACHELRANGKEITLASVHEVLHTLVASSDKSMRDILPASVETEGLRYLTDANFLITPGTDAKLNKEYLTYCEWIKDLSAKRKLISICNSFVKKIHIEETPAAMDEFMEEISSIQYSPSQSRFITIVSGVVNMSDPPIYQFVVKVAETHKTLTLSSEDLDKQVNVRRKIRELFNINPILPDSDSWGAFVHRIVLSAVKKDAPKLTHTGEGIAYWLREWFKLSTPAETVDDLPKGYVEKDGLIYFQPQRFIKWFKDNTKDTLPINKLWLFVDNRHGVKDKSIRIKDSTRKLWGMPSDFFQDTEDDDEIDISFLD